MNFRLGTQGPLLLTLVLITMTSVHVAEGRVKEVRAKRQSSLYNWGKDVFNNIKDSFGGLFGDEESTTTTTTTWTPPANYIRLTDAQCNAALTQCALIDVTEAEHHLTWSKDQLTSQLVEREVRKVHAHYRRILTQFRETINFLVNAAIQNPSLTSLQDLCDVTGREEHEETHITHPVTNSKTTTIPSTTPAPVKDSSTSASVPLAPRCQVSDWSEWSAPLGFGTQERVRVIVTPGQECPESKFLVQQRQFVVPSPNPNVPDGEHTEDTIYNITVVINNVIDDFIRASEGKPRDLMLVLDSSSSISDESFQVMKEGVKLLIDSLCGGFGPAPTQNRLSIVQFSTNSEIRLTFRGDQSPESIKKVIDNLKPLRGYTCTGDALNLAYLFFDKANGARSYAVHDTLVVTDGQSNCGAPLLQSSHKLQQRTNVYALAIGLSSTQTAVEEIKSLVFNGNPHHLFSLANFQQFQTMAESVRERQRVGWCQPIVLPDNY